MSQYITKPHTCAYLTDQLATLEYHHFPALSPSEYELLMNRGWRKFGAMVFRPICAQCHECRPIRIPIESFRPNRSQSRAWARNEDLRIHVGPVEFDEPRLDLYHRYHAAQSARKGWRAASDETAEYSATFEASSVPALEISAWMDTRLLAVLIADVTTNVVSDVYHYYDPDLPKRSLGTFMILWSIEIARRLKKRWVYLGFRVAGCESVSYKSNFRPCEIMDPSGVWRPFESFDDLT